MVNRVLLADFQPAPGFGPPPTQASDLGSAVSALQAGWGHYFLERSAFRPGHFLALGLLVGWLLDVWRDRWQMGDREIICHTE